MFAYYELYWVRFIIQTFVATHSSNKLQRPQKGTREHFFPQKRIYKVFIQTIDQGKFTDNISELDFKEKKIFFENSILCSN